MNHLDAMKAYVRVVELGSFTQAARELHVKQSTVSKWLRQLETEHHTTLLERTSRTQRVTEAGQQFYTRSKQILALYELAHAELQNHATTLSGRLRVSLPVVFGERFFIEPISRFAHAHPEVDLDLVFDDRYINMLEGDFDLAFRVGRPIDSRLHAIPLARLPRVLVASPDYIERRGLPASPEDLTHHNALLHSINQDDHWTFHTPRGAHRVPLTRAHVCANHSGALLTLAKQGFGIAMLANWLVTEELDRGDLVTILPHVTLPQVHIQALCTSPHISLRTRALVETFKQALAGMNLDKP